MNTKDIIDSHLIECYVLGAAEPKEAQLVEKYIKENKEVREVVLGFQKALENYSATYTVNAPNSAKDKIFDKISMDKETEIIDFKPASPVRTWWVAASLIIVSISILANVFLGMQAQKFKNELAQTKLNNQKLTFENLINKANYRSASEQLALIHKHGNKTTHLEGLTIAKEASAMIYWNSETKELYINIDHLPDAPQGKQYQLWALKAGKPVDAGVIDIHAADNTMYKMKNIDEAEAFAISLEKLGGVESPTMDAIYAMGSI